MATEQSVIVTSFDLIFDEISACGLITIIISFSGLQANIFHPFKRENVDLQYIPCTCCTWALSRKTNKNVTIVIAILIYRIPGFIAKRLCQRDKLSLLYSQ